VELNREVPNASPRLSLIASYLSSQGCFTWRISRLHAVALLFLLSMYPHGLLVPPPRCGVHRMLRIPVTPLARFQTLVVSRTMVGSISFRTARYFILLLAALLAKSAFTVFTRANGKTRVIALVILGGLAFNSIAGPRPHNTRNADT
jgi:hypothetical protein